MDFKDHLKQLSERVERLKDQIHTEEATKNAFIMPFIQVIGYDVFNPLEVVPEYISDIGIKKGEKVDYAILKDGQPVILIECKHWIENLDVHNSQLFRYFHTSKAKFAILTNGITYRFYTDLEESNKMDEKPFLEVNIMDIREAQVEELKKFHKSYFDVDQIFNTASELKYTNELRVILRNEMNNPTEPFVRLLAKQVYPGSVTAKVIEQFTVLTKKSFAQLLSDLIRERLSSALKKESETEKVAEESDGAEDATDRDSKIETTQDEIESFLIVKSIIRKRIAIERIAYRDAQSYFSILLDDNNRKPICRLYLSDSRKVLGTFDGNKKETKNQLASLDDIFKYEDQLIAVIETYEQ